MTINELCLCQGSTPTRRIRGCAHRSIISASSSTTLGMCAPWLQALPHPKVIKMSITADASKKVCRHTCKISSEESCGDGGQIVCQVMIMN